MGKRGQGPGARGGGGAIPRFAKAQRGLGPSGQERSAPSELSRNSDRRENNSASFPEVRWVRGQSPPPPPETGCILQR